MGGQSKERFQRAREEELKHWYKDIANIVCIYWNNRDIYLGCNPIYKNRLKEYLYKPILDSIKLEKSVSIDDNCLWELINKERKS